MNATFQFMRTAVASIVLALQASVWAAVVQNPSVTDIGNDRQGVMYIDPVVGYDFTPKRTLTVDYLGVFDDRSDGLYGPNTVGLFIRQTGQMLATATLDNSSLLENTFRWRRIPPVILQPGVVYNIAAFNWAEDPVMVNFQFVFTFSPDITVGAGYLEWDQPGLHMPTRQGGPNAVFIGPAFGTAVPEPSSAALAVVGCLAWAGMKRFQKNVGRV